MFYSLTSLSQLRVNQSAIGGSGGGFSNVFSLDFDGVSSHLDVSDPYTTIDARNTFSISCWIKIPSGGGGGVVGKNHTSSYNAKRFTFTASETRIEINTNSIAFRSATLSLSVDTWHSIIISIDRGRATQSDRCRVYLNGSPLTNALSSNFAQVTADASPLTIGTLTRGTSSPVILSPFEGKIDELAVWQTALTVSNVNDIFNNGTANNLNVLGISNLVNWYRMGDNNDGTGTTITDQGSGSNNGTLINSPTFESDAP
jgi:hypothetical protein